MMEISFEEARRAVGQPTEPQGFEDAEAFSVLLTDPPIDDTVVLVSKQDGSVRRVPRWDIQDRLDAMSPIPSTA